MKFQSFVLAALASLALVEASNPLQAGHGRLVRRSQSAVSHSKRCKARNPPKSDPNTGNNFAAANPSPNDNKGSDNTSHDDKPADKPNTDNGNQDKPSSDNNNDNNNNAQQPANNNNNNSNNNGSGAGGAAVITGSFDISAVSGPNGDIDYFNRGIDAGGWNPPYISIDQVKVVDLGQALSDPNSPFHACAPFTDMFYRHGGANNIPPIILASFAMQESSCNPNTVGGAGEQGLMQLTVDKCGGAPGGDCKNPDFNIRTGAEYFARTLSEKGGDLLQAIGSYNGWFKGMTYADATAAGSGPCCRCQNNLDYLQQFLNGWCQNVNAYQNHLGKYFNLDHC